MMIYKIRIRKWFDGTLMVLGHKETGYKLPEKSWFPVYVQWSDGDFIFDEIQGINKEDALKNAKWNWETASIIKIQTNGGN